VAFGRNKMVEPPVPAVGWVHVNQFTLGRVERPVTARRKRPVLGAPAVRVPTMTGGHRVHAPCAYFETAALFAHEANLASAAQLADMARSGLSMAPPQLYEDAEHQRPLCSLDSAEAEPDEVRLYRVRDGQGTVIGAIRRIPPKRPFRHTWRIDQPGHPEIVGRTEWASGAPAEVALLGVVKLGVTALGALADLGAEGGDQPTKPRTLDWRVDGESVMTSRGRESVTIRAGWLDRRIAFAFALLGDR
jgi:hypothetical protein